MEIFAILTACAILQGAGFAIGFIYGRYDKGRSGSRLIEIQDGETK